MDGIRTKEEEHERLKKLIAEWNASRVDLFAITEPSEDLEYRGVMRFYFQDAGAKMATKCVRVSNVENAEDVTNILVEKFRPDMKMLTNPNYSLYEVHPNGESRKLGKDERPLVVQLSWLQNDREGRFLLKSDSETLVTTNVFNTENDPGQSFKRKLSKREKKELKKKKEEEANRAKIFGPSSPTKTSDDSAIAQTLYNELPETSFTRSISNPEIVMKMRRQRKLERKLQEFQSNEGTDSGGTLKIFAETLKPEIPYKTLLVSMRDPTTHIVKEALEKYQMEKENPDDYCLVMVNIPPEGPNGTNTLGKERVVHDEDNPLAIAARWPKNQGHVVFHLRRRSNVLKHRQQKRRSKSPSRVPPDNTPDRSIGERLANSYPEHLLPYLKELSSDGRELDYEANIHRLPMEVTEVGSEKSMSSGGSYLELYEPHILPRHCVITNMDGIVSVTPTSGDAEVYVDGSRIYETTKLSHGSTVKFGRLHTFKFGDPAYEETPKPPGSPAPDGSVSSGQSDNDSQRRRDYRPESGGMKRGFEENNHESGMFETTFDVDGEINTYTKEKPYRDQPPQIIHTPPDSPDDVMGDKLPARLEFRESGEDAFFAAVISEVNGDRVHFKLAPTYTLYMCCRYRTSPAYREELTRQQRSERLSYTVQKIANMVRSTVEENSQLPGSLAFWMANSSELLHFLKQDVHISPQLNESQQVLAQSVQMAFRHLVQCVEQELRTLMSAFLDMTEDADMEDSDVESMMDPDSPDNVITGERSFRYGPSGRPIGGDSWLGGRRRHGKPTISDVLFTLSSAMSLLRRCRVNAALTIQVFSQLFHYINMWIFNKLVLQPQLGLCSRDWGHRLKRRLARVESWAQKQGLELAADCHLCRVVQAAHLLQSPKNSHSDINNVSSVCFKLNSVQLRALLENYRPAPDELDIPRDLIDNVVAVAENTADELLRNQGQEVTLEEDPQLQLPFLLPEDRYSSEVIRGVPAGLKEFLNPLAGIGLCRLTIQPNSSGFWTVYHMKNKDTGGDVAPRSSLTPEIMDVSFYKGQGGMGLSIVAAKGAGQDKLGIYIKQVVKDGPAANDGRLQAGDQLLAVNGESLVGVPQERAAELMVKSGANVTLCIAKQGAIYHGLATLLNQPTPVVSRDAQQNLVAVDNEDLVQASPTISEQEMQRPPGRWLQQDRDQSFNRWGDEDRGRRYQDQWQVDEDRRRREADEERRRVEEQRRKAEEERRLEEERIRAERERRYREEEERRLEEEKRQAEEQMRAEEERRKQEEERRLEEQRRRAEEQRRLEEERRRTEEQRRLEDERRRVEEQRKLEEERRLEEQRLYAEEQRRIEEARAREERRLAEEQRRLDEEHRREEERRMDEQRRFAEERRRQEGERKRAEDALKMIGEQQRRQKPSVSRPTAQVVQVEPVRSPYRVRFDDSEKDRQRSPLTVKVEEPEVVAQNRSRVYATPVSPGSTSPRRGSPKEDKSPDEPPSSPIRIDSRNSRFGRYIMVTQSQAGAQPEPDRKAPEPSDSWKPNERDEFSRWQQSEAKMAEERESALDRRDREERERREQEERAWRFHLEKQKLDQEDYNRRGKERLDREKQEREQRLEREKQEWERTRAERERQERERLERERRDRERQELERIERDRAERERAEREREREERERMEEERIMNQLQKEELDEQREREDHLKQLEEEQVQLRNMEQARMRAGHKGSKEYLDLMESLSADEVEREFQKRLEEERKRKEAAGDQEERAAGGLVSVTRVKYHAPDKEERMERGRKIDLLLDETMRRERERKEAEKRRQQKDEEEERLRSERQQRRVQQFEMDREQQRDAQRRMQEQREREQEEWLRQQREKRDQQRMEQEKLRLEKKMQEEEERNKKRQEIQQRRDQEERLRRESERQKLERERQMAEEQREAELRRDFERRKQLEEQNMIKEKEEQLRKQQIEDQRLQDGRTRKPSTEEHVNELKNRATADYERRRKLIDEEINRRRSEPVSVLKNSASSKPKKQVSFSNVATEISDPASPSYVVGTPSGYTARVTPAPSIKYVNTRAPSDAVPDSARPPLPDDDDDLPPPPPPPPPPDELLEDDGFPPPPPMKSSQSFDRFNALSGDRSRSLGYTSRITVTPQITRDTPEYPSAYSSSGVPLRQPPVTSSSAYPPYVTLPRKPRPISYPAPYEMNQQGPPPAPARYGSQENVLDGPPSRSQSQYAPKPARLDSDALNGSEIARGRLARMSLTDEEKSESQFVSKKPENLHFKDKLKMFNKESPEDKIRTSRWQQEQMAQLNGDLTSP